METQENISNEPVPLTTLIDALDYNMSHKHRGICVIFDNENFPPRRGIGTFARRTGSHVDSKSLYDVFGLLGFQVCIYKDLTARKISQTLKFFATMDHTNHDAFACCVLTHGEYGHLHSYDNRYPVDNLFVNFLGNKCPTLVGKPKLFFIQACQGTRLDNGVPVVSGDAFDGLSNHSMTLFKIPTFADFLIAQSTLPGFYSFRNTDLGSWFINALVETLREYHMKFDLLTMMTIVSQRVAYYFQSNAACSELSGMKQVPCFTSMLTRRVFFYPKSVKI